MNRHAEASFADPTRHRAIGLGRFTVVCLAIAGLVAFLGIGAPTASAIDTCPNVVFRTGPSAKLPECRAYELVSPSFTGGKPPTFEGFLGDLPGMFATDTVTPQGDSVVYNTFGGALSGFSGTGYVDRYRARRSAAGWVTEAVSPGGDERNSGIGDGPGGVSSDHEYAAEGAVEPTEKLVGPGFAGVGYMQILRTPNGYEPLAQGSLGVDSNNKAEAYWITAKGTHVIFGARKKLEPGAGEFVSPTHSEPVVGEENVYDRTPGGPTHVVSLLPDGTSPPRGSKFLGTTKNGVEVAFRAAPTLNQGQGIYVRRNDFATQEVVASNGVAVGRKLECEPRGSEGTFSYQWLRNGVATGDTTGTYTTTAADEGSVVQCLETDTGTESTNIATSETRFVDGYQGKTLPPHIFQLAIEPRGSAVATVGSPLTCVLASADDTTSGFTVTYQWLSEGTAIGGANSATYTPVEADAGNSLQCRMTLSNTSGASVAYSRARAIYRPAPQASANPAISNATSPGDLTPAVGDELTCSSGTWSASPSFAYQWLRGGEEIAGATSATYTTEAADEEKAVQCRVRATNAGGTTEAVSDGAAVDPQPATPAPEQTSPGSVFGASPEFSSAAPVGETLFCSEGNWEGNPSFAYQWLKDGTAIGGATSSTYTPTGADVGAVVQCRITATNEGGATVAVATNEGTKVVVRYLEHASPTVTPDPSARGFTFDGIFNGRVFYSDVPPTGQFYGEFGNLYMYDLDEEKTKTIEGQGDASIINVSEDGSHVYFVSTSALTGPEQNQYGNAAVAPAKGTGTLTAGSREVTGVNTSEGNFQPGMAIHGPGIPAPEQGELIERATTITAVGPGTLTLSEKATASGPVSLSASAPNLYVWTPQGESTKFIATVAQEDVESGGENTTAGLNTWAKALTTTEATFGLGRASSHTRSTADGSVLAFESTGQLTDFDNTEADAADCGRVGRNGLPTPGQGCDEVYRYDATSGELTCVSCGPGSGPATGEARLQSLNENGGLEGVAPATPNSPVESLTADGKMVFFESTEGLVPEDGNQTRDVYRWKQGAGVALISTGQGVGESALYGVTPDGSNAIFGTREKLLPQDLNGTVVRLYDARINGGFPPPEETVTEPCAGDICQDEATAAPQPPNVASSSLNGAGEAKPKLRCAKSSRRIVRKGNERCVHRKHHKRKRAHHKRRAPR